MPSQAWKNLMWLVLAAVSNGCSEDAAPTGNGRLDLIVMPESLIASGRPVQGSFELQGLDRATRLTLPLDGAGYQTRSLSLAPGVYTLRWRALPPTDFSPEAAAFAAPEAHGLEPRTVVIAAHRVTSLIVRSALATGEVPEPVAAVGQPREANAPPTQP